MEYIDFENNLDENYLNDIIFKIIENYIQSKKLYKDDKLIRRYIEIEKDDNKYYLIIDNNLKEKTVCNYFKSGNIEDFNNDKPIWEERLFTILNNGKMSYSIDKQNQYKTINILMDYFNLDKIDFEKKVEKFGQEFEKFIPGIFIDYDLVMSILKEKTHNQDNPFSSFDDEIYIDKNNNLVISHLDSCTFIFQKSHNDMKVFVSLDSYEEINDKITEDDIVFNFKDSKLVFANPDYINIFLMMFKDKTLNLFKEYKNYPVYPVDITSPDYVYNYRRKLYGASPMATVSDISRRIENFDEDGHVRLREIVYRTDVSDSNEFNKVFCEPHEKKEITYLKEIEFPLNLDERWIPEITKLSEHLKTNKPNIISCLLMNFFNKSNEESINFVVEDFTKKLENLKKEKKFTP